VRHRLPQQLVVYIQARCWRVCRLPLRRCRRLQPAYMLRLMRRRKDKPQPLPAIKSSAHEVKQACCYAV